MSVRGPQRLGLANQHEERSRCSSSLQLARRGLADVPSTAHTAAALQLKSKAAPGSNGWLTTAPFRVDPGIY